MKDFCTRPATDSGIVRDRGALCSVGVGVGGRGQVAKILGGAENMNTRSRARGGKVECRMRENPLGVSEGMVPRKVLK